jgi:hypothetical protein
MGIKNTFLVFVFLVALPFYSCKKKENGSSTGKERSYRMGFMNSAPRPVVDLALQSLGIWTQRSDAAIVSMEVPWDSLYAGVSCQQYVTNNLAELVNYYRGKNLKLWVYIDPANGLDRSSNSDKLKALNKSITQPDVQLQYRRFCVVMDSMLHPEHLGLALETNLVRGLSADSLYQAIKSAVNNAAADVRAIDANVKLSVSVQVDWAWGKLNNNSYVGIAQDFVDFPFIQELGLSSYPYFVFSDAKDIPDDYYARLVQGHSLPVFVSEGGWSSYSVNSYQGTQQKQKDYIARQEQLLDNAAAIAVFQLTFTDIDTTALPAGTPAGLNAFAGIGLVDIYMNTKPALNAWDTTFKRPLMSGH